MKSADEREAAFQLLYASLHLWASVLHAAAALYHLQRVPLKKAETEREMALRVLAERDV